MAIFETNIRNVRLPTFSPFTSEDMLGIGAAFMRSVQTRLTAGLDINDNPAPKLVDRYAKRKINYGLNPIRNWFWSGNTRDSIKVKTASENRVTVGPVTIRADTIITAQNRRCKQWPNSPKDDEAIYAEIRNVFTDKSTVLIEWIEDVGTAA